MVYIEKQKIIGLTSKQVLASREKYGSNVITKKDSETFFDKYKTNLKDPIIKILLFALIINLVFVFVGQTHWYESAGIAIAILLATIVSTWSEYKNEATFQKLQEDASRITCKVFRNGSIEEVLIDDIVVGDYVLLQAGDKVPADGILKDGEIKVDQATFTGESAELVKLKARANYVPEKKLDFSNKYQVFKSTVVSFGEGVLLVQKVGDLTEYGKLAFEMQTNERESPLKLKLSHLAKKISMFGYTGAILIALVFIFKEIIIANNFDVQQILLFMSDILNPINVLINALILAVIIIVVAIPEGLPMMIALVLSLNMRKMLKDNVLVRKLVGIETSGSLNILFSDKTGTITKGVLETIVFVGGNKKKYTAYSDIDSELRKLLHLSITQNTNALINDTDGVIKIIGGNATEKALLRFIQNEDWKPNVKKKFTIPFTSENKFSATQVKGDYDLTLIKGVPEKIVKQCTSYYDEKGVVRRLKNTAELDEIINELASRAIRVLAIAVSKDALKDKVPLKQMTLVGLVGIRDDVRTEVISAIQEVKEAGVQVVMITGDRKETAVAIAKEAGLIERKTDVMLTSDQLHDLTDDQLKKLLPKIRVIARALPSDKSRLVRLAQETGLVVGMTGDGVNDAPALKKADVGFAMGSGTEVAKEAGDIVILDDNFLSIEKAVLYGRTIYKNIRKFIVFQLSINVAAVLISFLGPLVGIVRPLDITQMLWINLVMDTLAALAFGGEPALRSYMKEQSKKRDERIVSKNMLSAILTSAVAVTLLSLFYFKSDFIGAFFAFGDTEQYLYTGYFAFFVLISILNGFNARTDSLHIFSYINKNPKFLKVMGFIILVQIVITYFGGVIFRSFGLTLEQWVVIVLMSLLIIPIDMVRKLIMRRVSEK